MREGTSESLEHQLQGGLIHDTLLRARRDQEFGEFLAELDEVRLRREAFRAEHGRLPNCLEHMRMHKEAAGEEVPEGWEEQIIAAAKEMQRREDAGESLTEILEAARG